MTTDKLLIVDDEHAEFMSKIYSVRGFEVFTAIDGREAVEVAAKVNPDLVLLDIMLPVLDGFKVLEELKKREIATRVVMFSAYFNSVDTAIRCIRSGACDFIGKLDMDFDEMADRIRKYILQETTLNLRVSSTTPVVEKLIRQVESITSTLDKVRAENLELKSRNFRTELISKSCYVVLSVCSMSMLRFFNIVDSGLSLTLTFLFLMILLMIPTAKIQSISAQLSKLNAKISLRE